MQMRVLIAAAFLLASLLFICCHADIDELDQQSYESHRFRRYSEAHNEEEQQDRRPEYADTWVIHVPAGKEVAEQIAKDAGFRFLGQVRCMMSC